VCLCVLRAFESNENVLKLNEKKNKKKKKKKEKYKKREFLAFLGVGRERILRERERELLLNAT